MVILGIDPGLAIVGWGVVEYKNSKFKTLGYGAITTPKEMKTEQRLKKIYDDLAEIIKKYRPDHVAIEELFFNTNITTGIRVSEARGVVLLSARKHGLEIAEYTPLQAKQAVVGYGRAEKKQVMEMVRQLLNLKAVPKPDDTADALAIAICHCHASGTALRQFLR